MAKNLYEKVFDSHVIRRVGGDQYQIFIGLHLVHEATTAPAFSALRKKGVSVQYPDRTFATADHVIPTTKEARPFQDKMNEDMISALEDNTKDFGIRYFSPENKENGIVHIIGPEKGLTQPGMTIVCGDSHTSTHGAFGAIGMGIGTTQVRDVLATQSLVTKRLKVRKIEVTGSLSSGVTAKDVILHIIRILGVRAGVGYAYEFAGDVLDNMSMDERMTMCNMAVEAGARCGYVNPDKTTYDYIKGTEYSPKGSDWDKALKYWGSLASDEDAEFDDHVVIDAKEIEPMTTWGVSLEQAIAINESVPSLEGLDDDDKKAALYAAEFMEFDLGKSILGTPINVAFIGSCTNGRLSDFEEVINVLKSGNHQVPKTVKALIVPGSQYIARRMKEKGWDKIFLNAGFEFREPGCSMCLAMNPDKLDGRQLCASASNRNFKGRQGSPTGRTLVMSPISVAACAVTGVVSDPRKIFKLN
jgi:3-isopropylmalate/(R)-2-methylmalate dehydratase large subunit